MELQNRTILITGGTSGIGLELVKQLTELGAKVIITGRNLDALKDAKKNFPNIHIYQSDVSKTKDIEALYNELIASFPELSIIINNAGIMCEIDLLDNTIPLADISKEIDINLTGAIQMAHQFLPHLIKQKSAAIINVSSGIAFMPYSIAPIYSASKAGVRAYTRALRLQLEDSNIKVFEVIPPGVETPLEKDWSYKQNPNQMMKVDKMVSIALRGIMRNELEIKAGMAKLAKTMSRLAPEFVIKQGHNAFKKFKQNKK